MTIIYSYFILQTNKPAPQEFKSTSDSLERRVLVNNPVFPDSAFKTPQGGWCGNRPVCVAVAIQPEGVAVRNSADAAKSTVYFSHEEWAAFTGAVKEGQFAVT